MKKITTLSILIFFLISVNNCAGYKPIFASGDLNFTIQDSKIDGDKIIGGRIYSNLERLSSKNTEKGNTKMVAIYINVSKSNIATLKESTGEIKEYKIILTTNIKINDYLEDYIYVNQIFEESASYKVQENYSDTLSLEKRITNNLIDSIYQNIITKFSQNIAAK